MHDGFGSIIEIREPTVGEIKNRLDILASCGCGHSRSIRAEAICIHPETQVSDVGDHLTCSKCRTKGLSTRIAPRSI